jgi:hypothetical protein
MSNSYKQDITVEVKWVPTDPRGALPEHHWLGTLVINGEIEHQRRYFGKWMAMEDVQEWLSYQTEVEKEIATMSGERS